VVEEEEPPERAEANRFPEDWPRPARVGVLGVGDPTTMGVENTSSSSRTHGSDAGRLIALPNGRAGIEEGSPKRGWPAGFVGAMGRGGGGKVRP
jgi:hypothetical protein